MKKLFVSFSTLLSLIAHDKVSAEDLRTGFYLFGCTRGHALEPGAQGEADERQWNKGKNAAGHETLVAAVLEAEKEGRAGWVKTGRYLDRDPYEVLSDLITKHGMPPLIRKGGDASMHNYPAMRDAIEEAGIPLEVVF